MTHTTSPSSTDGLAEAITDAAQALHSCHTIEDTLDSVVAGVRSLVPGVDDVGIVVLDARGAVETRAGAGPVAWQLDGLQHDLDQGPMLDAMRHEPVVLADDLAAESRWSVYRAHALEAGILTQAGIRMTFEQGTTGVLSLYSHRDHAIDTEGIRSARLFASHAAVAVGRMRNEMQLAEALRTSSVIAKATGLVMARYQLTDDQSLTYLARMASKSGLRLHDIATELVTTVNERNARAAAVDESDSECVAVVERRFSHDA